MVIKKEGRNKDKVLNLDMKEGSEREKRKGAGCRRGDERRCRAR